MQMMVCLILDFNHISKGKGLHAWSYEISFFFLVNGTYEIS